MFLQESGEKGNSNAASSGTATLVMGTLMVVLSVVTLFFATRDHMKTLKH